MLLCVLVSLLINVIPGPVFARRRNKELLPIKTELGHTLLTHIHVGVCVYFPPLPRTASLPVLRHLRTEHKRVNSAN